MSTSKDSKGPWPLAWTFLAALIVGAQARAQGRVPLDAPLIDAPYNTSHERSWPSMQQALRLSASSYQLLHYGLEQWIDPYEGGWRGFRHVLGFILVDSLYGYFPIGDAWLHEEFHRTVMGQYGIGSYNGVNDVPIGASMISVYRVRDEDLVRLKRDHAPDMVRLPAAGIEGQLELVLQLEKDAFFRDAHNFHIPLYWAQYFNSIFYVGSAAADSDEMTDDMNAKEPRVSQRDFVGHDFTSWVYDLHRPDEPYEDRGMHPSGVGIDRYRKYEQLTEGERRYLALQGRLQWLNLVDPQLIGWQGWNLDDASAAKISGSIRHYLTSFGFTVDANAFYRSGDLNLFATAHQYRNRERSLPGASLELVRYPLHQAGTVLPDYLSLRGDIWQQPAHQRYDDDSAKTGGLAAARVFWKLTPSTEWYLDVETKTAGWVAGNPYLDHNTSGRVGISASLF